MRRLRAIGDTVALRTCLAAERLRSWLIVAWPFLASAAAVSVVVAAVTVVLSALDDAEERDRQAATLATVVREATAANETTRQVLAQVRPCVVGDPADSPACLAQTARDRRIADAIDAIASQHDEVLARLERLIARPAAQHGATAPQAAPIPRSAPPPRSGAGKAPSVTTATTAAPAPTTTCPERGKRPKECRG